MARPQNTYRGARRGSGHYKPLIGTAFQPQAPSKGSLDHLLERSVKHYRWQWKTGKYTPWVEDLKHYNRIKWNMMRTVGMVSP